MMMKMMMKMEHGDGGSVFVIRFISLVISSSRAKAIRNDKFHLISFHFNLLSHKIMSLRAIAINSQTIGKQTLK